MSEKKPPKYTNTPYGRVLTSSLNKGPTISASTLKTLETTPNIPGNTYYIDPKKENPVKTADTSMYVQTVQETKSDISVEERLAFMALTGNEILEVSRNFDMSNNSLSLNRNVLDSTNVVNAVSPIQLIKMQSSNNDYLANSTRTVEGTTTAITPTTGNATISAPASTVSSSTTSSNGGTATTGNTTQIKVEVQAPAKTVSQKTTPTWSLISFTPSSAKKGHKITVTHERCNVNRTVTIGTVASTYSNTTKTTFNITVPNSPSLVVGQSYEISVTIKGETKKVPGLLTIIA